MTSEGPRRSQRSTKGKGPNKFGWDKVPDSVSQARSRHTSSSFRSREIAMFRAGQSELETATKIAELEISSMRKELELRKELAEKRVALEKRAAELELPSSSSPSWEEGDSVGGDDVDLEDALGAEKRLTVQAVKQHNQLIGKARSVIDAERTQRPSTSRPGYASSLPMHIHVDDSGKTANFVPVSRVSEYLHGNVAACQPSSVSEVSVVSKPLTALLSEATQPRAVEHTAMNATHTPGQPIIQSDPLLQPISVAVPLSNPAVWPGAPVMHCISALSPQQTVHVQKSTTPTGTQPVWSTVYTATAATAKPAKPSVLTAPRNVPPVVAQPVSQAMPVLLSNGYAPLQPPTGQIYMPHDHAHVTASVPAKTILPDPINSLMPQKMLNGGEKTESLSAEAPTFTPVTRQGFPSPHVQPYHVVPQLYRPSSSHHMQPMKLPKFDGKQSNYVTWRQRFDRLVDEDMAISEDYKFERLREALAGGAADEIIAGVIDGAGAYQAALAELAAWYGGSDREMERQQRELLALSRVTNERDVAGLEKLAIKLRNLLINMRSYKVYPGRDLYLNVSQKLPRSMLLRFVDQHDDSTSDVYRLSEWLLDRVRKFRQVDQRLTTDQRPKIERTFLTGGSFGPSPPSKPDRQPIKYDKPRGTCRKCNEIHELEDCRSFQDLPSRRKWDLVKLTQLCLCCLKPGHRSKECQAKKCSAKGCGRPHHVLLHYDRSDKAAEQPTKSSGKAPAQEGTLHTTQLSQNVAFMTLPVTVQPEGGSKMTVTCTALLDSASTTSYISQDIADALGLHTEPEDVSISVLGGHTMKAKRRRVPLVVGSADSSVEQPLTAWVLPEVTSMSSIDTQPLQKKWPHLADICIPSSGTSKIDMLIGLDAIDMHHVLEERRGGANEPIGRRVPLGWIVMGPLNNSANNHHTMLTLQEPETLVEQVDWLCSVELVGSEPAQAHVSHADIEAERKTTESLSYSNSRFTVGIPWKHDDDKPHIQSNRALAECRLKSLERTFSSKPQLREKYEKVIATHLDKQYVRRVPPEEVQQDGDDQWYLPHFPVVRDDKETTKVRVVYDGSVKSNGHCLNAEMHSGPNMIADLVQILLRFCLHPVALVADITEMFLQVALRPADRKYHRFLWRDSATSATQVLEFCRVVFGIKASPYLAGRMIKETAHRFGDQHSPSVKEAVEKDFFVDDFVSSQPSVEAAQTVQREGQQLLHKGSFHLRKWRSNMPEALTHVPAEDRGKGDLLNLSTVEDKQGQLTKTLGVAWDCRSDCFTFNYPSPDPKQLTRHVVLSKLSSIFDPRGQIAPFTVRGRMMFQELWILGRDWDSPLPETHTAKWRAWFEELPDLSAIKADRCFKPLEAGAATPEISLHTFTDASERAIAAATYVRVEYPGEEVKVTLAFAKAKPSPVKRVTIPKLELRGAVLGIRVNAVVAEALQIAPENCYFWSDSMNVLYWVRSSAHRFVIDVANRVSEIQTSSKGTQWRHVPGKLNPADKGTRGLKAQQLAVDTVWWSGPTFLKTGDWPQSSIDVPDSLPNEKRHQQHTMVNQLSADQDCVIDVTQSSDVNKLCRLIAWCYRFIQNSKLSARATRERVELPAKEVGNILTANELLRVERYLVACAQRKSYGDTIKRLSESKPLLASDPLIKLKPMLQFADANRLPLLVMDGRLRFSPIVSEGLRQPVILPSKHHLTHLIVAREDEQAQHTAGANHLLSLLREKYWIVHGLATVKACRAKCSSCRRLHNRPAEQIMGPLPDFRTGGPTLPFAHTAVDYAGPLLVKHGRRAQAKRWICLFTCLLTRAVHLELAFGLDTTSFLLAFTRFAKRRGTPVVMLSDNGTNFSSADKELRAAVAELNRNEISASLAQKGTTMKWQFNPPRAPHHGGVFEIMIRCAKRALQSTIGKASLTDEELLTALTQAEWLLNTRPLTLVSTDPQDESPLTPQHFLAGNVDTPLPIEDRADARDRVNPRDRWQVVQATLSHFWNRWLKEILPSLNIRQRWHKQKRSLAVGDIVLAIATGTPRGRWPLARVSKVHPGPDGVVRVVDVTINKKIYRRAITSLIPLESE